MNLKCVFGLLLLSFLSCSEDEGTSYSFSGEVQKVSVLGGSNNESAQKVIATSDGGFAVVAYTHSNDGGITATTDQSFNFLLLKYSENGDLQWQRAYGGSDEERAYNLVQTADNGFVLVGFSKSADGDVDTNAGGRDVWVIKVDALGNKIWQKTHGFQGSDYGLNVIQTSDNGLLLSGVLDVTSSGGAGTDRNTLHAGGDYWLIKLDAQGNKEWRKYYGGNQSDIPYGMVETSSGDFIIAGETDSTDTDISVNNGAYDFWVIKVDAEGTLLWEKTYGGSGFDRAFGIIKTTDGNYIVTGDTSSTDGDAGVAIGGIDVWNMKIDDEGNILWKNRIGGSAFDASRGICNTRDGGAFLVGSSRSVDGDISENKGNGDALIAKIQSNGALEWHKTIGGTELDFFYGVAQLNNGTVVAVGDTMSEDGDVGMNNGFTDILITLIK